MPSGRSGTVPDAGCNSSSVTSDTSSIPNNSFVLIARRDIHTHEYVTFQSKYLTPVIFFMYDLLLLLLHKHLLGSLHFFLLNTEEKVSHVFLILPAELKGSVRTYRVLLLLSPAVTVVTLRVGLHGHGGEEILHCIVAQIVTDLSKLQQVSGSIESTFYKLPQPLNVNPAPHNGD